jgi:hypothetical protein
MIGSLFVMLCMKENGHRMRISVLLAILILAVASGCERPEQRQVVQHKEVDQSRVDDDVRALADARGKIQALSGRIDQIGLENQRLKARNDLLESQARDMQPLIRQLVAGYGTGIWDYGNNINFPVFVRSMRGANVREVIAALNERFRKFGQPRILYKKKHDHTVFIGVDNEDQLGEQMGSNGALSYMTSVT